MATYRVKVYRSGYVRVGSEGLVDADSQEGAAAEALSMGVEWGMDIIRNDLAVDDTDVRLETPND